MKRLLCLALSIFALLWAASGPAQEPVSGIVQVAINYGPRQDGYFSGVIVGDGRIVLTDSGTAARAREIAIAFSDGEILETVMAQIQSFNHIAVLPMTAHHGQIVALSPLARETSPQGDVEAVAGGAPKAFQVDRRVVHLHPVGSGAALRWQITPSLPPTFRGGPLLTNQGQLIAMIVLESETLVGMPLGEMLAMVDVAAGPQTPVPATIKREPASEPASGNTDNPSLPQVTKEVAKAVTKEAAPPVTNSPARPRPSTPADTSTPPPETKTATPEPARTTPAEDSIASVFKDSAIAALRLEPPVVPKPTVPAKAGSAPASRVIPWKARLTPIRTTWAWNTEVPPPAPSLNAKLPPIRASWLWSSDVRPPTPTLNVKLPRIRTAWAWPPALPPPPPVQVAEAPSVPATSKPTKEKPKKVAAEQAPPPAPAPTPAVESTPRDVDAFLQEAAGLMQSKDYPKAVDTLEEAIRQHPDAAHLYFQVALAYWYKALQKPDGSRRSTMEKASYHKAIKSFQTFLEKAPNDPLANEARMHLTVLRNAQYGGGL
jgi:hypothetical protein